MFPGIRGHRENFRSGSPEFGDAGSIFIRVPRNPGKPGAFSFGFAGNRGRREHFHSGSPETGDVASILFDIPQANEASAAFGRGHMGGVSG